MAAPVMSFNSPNASEKPGDDLPKERANDALLYGAAVAASLGVPFCMAAGQSITPDTPAKPTLFEWTGLPDGRRYRVQISYTGDLVTQIVLEVDEGSGYEIFSTTTYTYDQDGNFSGASS